MLVQRPVHLELEITKWVIVLVIATAFFLGLIVSSSAGADAESKSEPKLLPPDIQVTAKPMLATDVESSPVARLPDQVTSHRDNLAVWEAILDQIWDVDVGCLTYLSISETNKPSTTTNQQLP